MNVDNYCFEVVDEFTYLGSSVNKKNKVSQEIKRRIVLSNRCLYGLRQHFSNTTFSRNTKKQLYQVLILPVLLYAAESWVLTITDIQNLGVFERKVLRKIYGPICVEGQFRHRMNHELYELLVGHVVRMEQNVPAKKVFEGKVDGTRRRGATCLRWKNQVPDGLE